MTSKLKTYSFPYSNPETFPAERMRQVIGLKFNHPDQLSTEKMDTLLPILVSKRKMEEMAKIRVHINALAKDEVLSSDQVKSLVFFRGVEVLAAECQASMRTLSEELQKFMGALPR